MPLLAPASVSTERRMRWRTGTGYQDDALVGGHVGRGRNMRCRDCVVKGTCTFILMQYSRVTVAQNSQMKGLESTRGESDGV